MSRSLTQTRIRRAIIVVAGGLSINAASVLSAQPSRVTVVDFGVGSEFENYLRLLQVGGAAPLYPWSLRGFSRREVSRLMALDSAGPWALRGRLDTARVAAGSVTVGAIFNSAYPYGSNDGAVWAGRGLTSVIGAAASGNLGPFSLSLAPLAFRAGNRPFDLLPNGRSGLLVFNHGTRGADVDLPQRFGDRPYARLDPGASTLRLDTKFVTFGLSTANEWIGPATEYPFLLGNNASGFPHLFLGTGEPVNIWIGRLHARLMWAKLYQSEYSPVSGSERYVAERETGTIRLATSAAAVLQPRGIPGLEIGFGRFIHVPNMAGEPSSDFWGKAFRVFFLKNEYAREDSGLDNELASAFFRWVFPNSGFELFGERGYEDHFYDFRDLIQDPDHNRAYVLGFQKVIRRRERSFDVFKGEAINYQLPTIARLRLENAVYVHGVLSQGHTHRGQLLGANAGVGAGAASTLAWSRYAPSGRTTLSLRRIVRDESGTYHVDGVENQRASDVIVALGFERVRFGHRIDVGARVEGMRNYNRNFSNDVGNVNLQLTATYRP